MKIFIFFPFAFLLFSNSDCKNKNEFDTSEFKAIRINYSYPMLFDSGQIIKEEDSIDICYYKNYTLYKIPFIKDSFRLVLSKDNEMEQELVKREVKFKYFIYDTTGKYGYRYESLNTIKNKRVSVDSFLNEHMIGQMQPIYLNIVQNGKLVQSNHLSKDNLLDIYIPRNKVSASSPDTNYLYFTNDSRIREISFSLAPKVDSIKQMKLYKTRLIYNVNLDSKDVYGKAAKELSFDLKVVNIENEKALIDFIERIKKQGL